MPTWSAVAKEHLEKIINRTEDIPSSPKNKLDGPFISFVTEDWSQSKSRTIYVGQETREDIGEMFRDSSKLRAHIENYRKSFSDFDYGKSIKHTPFWSFHRGLATSLESGNYRAIPWLNLLKYNTGPMGKDTTSLMNLSEKEAQLLLTAQRGQVEAEISDLRPDAVVFVTGPNYDVALESEFPNKRLEPVDDFAERELSRVIHPSLPSNSFRTYHPRYLRQSRREDMVFQKIVSLISGQSCS